MPTHAKRRLRLVLGQEQKLQHTLRFLWQQTQGQGDALSGYYAVRQ